VTLLYGGLGLLCVVPIGLAGCIISARIQNGRTKGRHTARDQINFTGPEREHPRAR
jgi:hypothetical protein